MIKRLAIAALLIALPLTTADPTFAGESKSANTVAVCGCGKVFTPDEKTEHVTSGGKSYACCSHACHEMAAKDPAGSAKMTEAAVAKFTGKAKVDLNVANVLAVTETGTKALCGCGKEFALDQTTPFFHVDGESFASCSKGCQEMAMKDPKTAAKATRDKLASRQ
jgi:hypothetical protein